MFEGHDQAVFDLVSEHRLVPAGQLDLARDEHRASGKPLAVVLLDLGLLERPALFRAIAAHLGAEWVEPLPATLPGEALALVAPPLARTYGVAPLAADLTSVTLAAVDPFNGQLIGDLTFALERDIRLVVADPARVASLIRRHYGEDEASLADAAGELAAQLGQESARDDFTEADLEQLAGQTPLIHFVNLVLGQAIRDRASDIHFEPFEHEFRIRYRIDGALHELAPPPLHLARPVISRLKVLANLNIAEQRVPQDGRIRLTLGGRAVDLRVSTLPTQFGESVVLRVLDQSAVQLDLRQLGLPAPLEAGLRTALGRPNGIILVTGPTGSGKTTTLYSCLRELNVPEVKILTVEDPVEFELEGIMQVPVNPGADLGFARALRAFLRQDPDIVMVGEIRDLETAQIALQASLTGHLVLTTLHTNDAPAAVTRLVDMGIEPFLLASTLEVVLAQRLVRRLCPVCRAPGPPDAATLHQLGLPAEVFGGEPVCAAVGCPACHQTGFRGRLGLFEYLPMTDHLRELVVTGAALADLRSEAVAAGMVPLRDAGLRAVRAGETTLEEMARYL